MSVLSRGLLKERLNQPPETRSSLVVTPMLTFDEAFDADSIDLRLGNQFLVPRSFQEPFYCPDRRSASSLHARIHVPFGEYLVVPAHQTVLGATLEFIKLPYDVAGQVLTKSSIARMFVVIETAPWIHPEYRGCLTLEIANVSNTPVLLYPGRYIAQMVLSTVDVNAAHVGLETETAAKLSGRYFGPTAPEAPRFNDPGADLAAIGVKRVRTIEQRVSRISPVL